MRADRLLALLLLLQTRGRLSAASLAAEVGVSQRTIYRDMLALSTAGVPVYAEAGRDGGYALVESYRTNLTGLKESESRALFLALATLSAAQPLAELGVGAELEAALRKLTAALPAAHRDEEAHLRQRFLLDTAGWDVDTGVPNLPAVQVAVWNDRCLRIRYALFGGMVSEQIVEPYGLVVKAGVWHLVYTRLGRMRIRRLSSLLEAQPLDETFTRPPAFNLQAFWQSYLAERQDAAPGFVVRARVAPHFARQLHFYFGSSIQSQLERHSPPDEAGWLTLELPFDSFDDARRRLLGFGGAVEVLEPPELRLTIQDYAAQVAALYARAR
jgi:predicted DNA-binding transcriptional regulator YafY